MYSILRVRVRKSLQISYNNFLIFLPLNLWVKSRQTPYLLVYSVGRDFALLPCTPKRKQSSKGRTPIVENRALRWWKTEVVENKMATPLVENIGRGKQNGSPW